MRRIVGVVAGVMLAVALTMGVAWGEGVEKEKTPAGQLAFAQNEKNAPAARARASYAYAASLGSRYEKALPYYVKAVELADKSCADLQEMWWNLDWAGQGATTADRQLATIRAMDRFVELFPDSPDVPYAKVRKVCCLLWRHQDAEALALAKEAVQDARMSKRLREDTQGKIRWMEAPDQAETQAIGFEVRGPVGQLAGALEEEAARKKVETEAVKTVAKEFLGAVRDGDVKKVRESIVETAPKWTKERMESWYIPLIHEAYGAKPESMTDIQEIAFQGDYAAVRLPVVAASADGRYLFVVLKRTEAAWRPCYGNDALPKVPLAGSLWRFIAEEEAKPAALEFRIVPNEAGSERKPAMTPNFKVYVDNLTKEGPEEGRIRGDEFQWFEAYDAMKDLAGTSEWRGRTYILLTSKAPYVMRPRTEGPDAWGLKNVSVQQVEGGGRAVAFEFDDRGAKMFGEFTKANIGNRMAIVARGKMRSAPTLRMAINGSSMIMEGNFTAAEAEALAADLKAVVKTEFKQPGAGKTER